MTTKLSLNQINGKIPTWTKRTAGEHNYWVARATVHGVGPASYGRRSAGVTIRVAQRPTDGRWITDIAHQPLGLGCKAVRVVAETDSREQAQAAAIDRLPELIAVIAEQHSPSSVAVGPTRTQWQPE
jgi:hypothetical protein